MDIVVPEKSKLSIEALYFDITIDGPVREVRIPNSLGRIDVRNVDGVVDITTVNQRVEAEDLTGDISLMTSNAPMSVHNVRATKKAARFRNDNGDITIEGMIGSVNVSNDYGRIEVLDFEPGKEGNIIRGSSGPIVVDVSHLSDGSIFINNRYEDIEVSIPSSVSTRLSLSVDEEGKISVENIPVRADLVQPTRMNLVSGEGAALVSASISGSGNIYIRGAGAGE
jgi:DUF4097 and DUF4098 domain-containing protein YvlB